MMLCQFSSILSVLLLLPRGGQAILGPFWTRDATVAGGFYVAYNLSVPVDHFHNDSIYEPHSDRTFPLRYWFDSQFYQDGGPVILLAVGETGGEDRLPFLQKGIVALLSKATHGLGVVLEHRYYGRSFPVPDLSTENMRFLTTDQAMADAAYFARNIKFPGFEDVDLTAPNTPYIVYGGSYAGAFAAFLRKLYPDVFWGAISSSGVTAAIVDYWEYYEASRLFGPEKCVGLTQDLVYLVDNILLGENGTTKQTLKEVFGLGHLDHDTDFVNVLKHGIDGLQRTNWDPAVSKADFNYYCGNISATTHLYPVSEDLESVVDGLIVAGGCGDKVEALRPAVLNLIGYTELTKLKRCKKGIKKCFCRHDENFYRQDDLHQWEWRSWLYQVCTEWGYFQTGSGVPESQRPMISRLIDLDEETRICRVSFNISSLPDVEKINKHGGFNMSYARLAIIDGEADPWRAATPHRIGLPDRVSTIDEPFLLIKDGVHHWDENGVFQNETKDDFPPRAVMEVQAKEVEFVKAWMEQLYLEKELVPGSEEL